MVQIARIKRLDLNERESEARTYKSIKVLAYLETFFLLRSREKNVTSYFYAYFKAI